MHQSGSDTGGRPLFFSNLISHMDRPRFSLAPLQCHRKRDADQWDEWPRRLRVLVLGKVDTESLFGRPADESKSCRKGSARQRQAQPVSPSQALAIKKELGARQCNHGSIKYRLKATPVLSCTRFDVILIWSSSYTHARLSVSSW